MTPVPAIPLPEPLPLPAPVWLLWALLTLTALLHLLAMNLLLGGSALAAYAKIRHGASEHGRALVSTFTQAAPVLVAATVTLGVAPLLFLQVLYGRLFFVSSILMAWSWLAVMPVLVAIYYVAYRLAWRAGRGLPAAGSAVYVAVAAALAAVGFVLTTNMSLMMRPDRFAALYDSGSGLHLNLDDPTIWPRWLHMVLGAVAVAGAALVLLGAWHRANRPVLADWARHHGARWSAWATAANVVVGFWWLGSLQSPVVTSFLAGSLGRGLLLAAGVTAGVAAFILLASAARPGASWATAFGAAGALGATVVAMVLVRDAIRSATLEAYGFQTQIWVAAQWPTIALFAVLLVSAVALVAWMAFVMARAPAPAVAK